MQNEKCNQRSAWEVMNALDDFGESLQHWTGYVSSALQYSPATQHKVYLKLSEILFNTQSAIILVDSANR